MRALLLTAALTLAACSSATSSSNVRSGIPNAPNVATHTDSTGLTLDILNAAGLSVVGTAAEKSALQCITSVTPEITVIRGGESVKVGLKADTQGACKDGERKAVFFVTAYSFATQYAGTLRVTYSPATGNWSGTLTREKYGNWNLCPEPSLPEKGQQLENDTRITIKWCPTP